jgi:hypothetical protein
MTCKISCMVSAQTVIRMYAHGSSEHNIDRVLLVLLHGPNPCKLERWANDVKVV